VVELHKPVAAHTHKQALEPHSDANDASSASHDHIYASDVHANHYHHRRHDLTNDLAIRHGQWQLQVR
jgi:hypothetical protein